MLARDPADRPAARDVATALEPLVTALPTELPVSRRGRLRGGPTESACRLRSRAAWGEASGGRQLMSASGQLGER